MFAKIRAFAPLLKSGSFLQADLFTPSLSKPCRTRSYPTLACVWSLAAARRDSRGVYKTVLIKRN
jgi:hypothetical protein